MNEWMAGMDFWLAGFAKKKLELPGEWRNYWSMKRFIPLLVCLLALPAMAKDWEKKDPATQSQENLKSAKEMRNEARYMEEAALKLEGSEAKTVKKYAEATSEEAEWLEKSSVAYGKNQLRLAEKYQRKAAEYCEKRGKMLKDIEAIRHKLKGTPAKSVEKDAASKADKLAEIERQQAALEEEKTKLLQGSSQ